MAIVLLTIVLSISTTSCNNVDEFTFVRDKAFKGDSMLTEAYPVRSEEQFLALADSLYEVGYISIWKRAIAHNTVATNHGDVRKSLEILREALKEDNPRTEKDSVAYYFCVAEMARDLNTQSHHEEALRLATSALEPIKKIGNYYYRNDLLSMLYDIITNTQYTLRLFDEADQSSEEAFTYSADASAALTNVPSVMTTMHFVEATLSRLQEQERYKDAEKWLKRGDSLVNVLKTLDGLEPLELDYRQAIIIFHHAKNELGLKHAEAAEKAYQKFLNTEYAKTYEGQLCKADYMVLAKRWSEAADMMVGLEDYFASYDKNLSLDVLRQLSTKFLANYKAGRRDTALHVANYIIENLDSAIFHERESNTAEMATIYETQKKDAEIAQQKIELTQERMIGLVIAIILLTIFFVVYTLIRRRAAKRMAEMRAHQERIENELQIARNIQMSMVPSQFPDYEGLDMYASMTPAKEVGGDLYGYVLIGDKLYFALGDVSGKGVPASLFMAQATRLFRTLAAQQMMPAEICTRMNDALSGEDNESGMFVTFWLGLVDLKTGHLNFCNAGHNPPVIGGGESHGEFLEMIPNAPIGLWPGLEYEGEEIDTIKGRPMFIYTDGLNEAENRQQEQFGDDRLVEILRTTHFDSAQQVIDTLKAEVEQHRDGAEPNDDLTMMCVRVN